MAYFCPKRFNRLPRFTIFFKKGQKAAQSRYINENTVSLNADFLKFLSDKRNIPQGDADGATAGGGQGKADEQKTTQHGTDDRGESQEEQQLKLELQEIESAETAAKKSIDRVPSEVEQWNEYLK